MSYDVEFEKKKSDFLPSSQLFQISENPEKRTKIVVIVYRLSRVSWCFCCNKVFCSSLITCIITYGAKLLTADWLRQRAFFLNHEGTFGNQEVINT